MRAYYDLIQHLKTTFESVYSVNTVTTEGYNDLDNWRKNIYPIVDIYVSTSTPILTTTALTQFNVEITCLDIRDWNNEEVNDKFFRNDNRHDVWNTTHAILEQGKDKLIKDHLDTNITLLSATELERISWGKENGLDGWRTSWVIEVPKTYNTSCPLLEAISVSLDNTGAGLMTELTVNFTDAVRSSGSGEVNIYDSSDVLIDTLDSLDISSEDDNYLVFDLTGSPLVSEAADDFYVLIDGGFATGLRTGENSKSVTDKTQLTFTIV